MEDKVNFLAGQHHALLCTVYALITTHPEAERLQKEFVRVTEAALSTTIPTTVPEQYLQGFQEEKADLASLIQAATRIVRIAK